MTKRSWSIDSLVLIFSFIVFAQLLSYVVPHGQFERVPAESNPDRMVVVDGTYARLAGEESVTLPPWHFLMALSDGLESAQGIIFLIFLVGGVIAVLRKTGAIDAALHGAVDKLGKTSLAADRWLPGPVQCRLVHHWHGRRVCAVGADHRNDVPGYADGCHRGYGHGLDTLWHWLGLCRHQPFWCPDRTRYRERAADIGLGLYALSIMFVFLAVAFHHIYRYAMRVQTDPSASLVADVDYSSGFDAPGDLAFTGRRIAILAVFVLGLVAFVYGVSAFHWYITELNAIFLGIGLIAADHCAHVRRRHQPHLSLKAPRQ